jgi:hypothetical protein
MSKKRSAPQAGYEAAIWRRLVEGDQLCFTPAAAKAILAVGFAPADQERMRQLMARSKEGNLTAEEQAEIDAFSQVGSVLGILKSKARQSLESIRAKKVESKAQ